MPRCFLERENAATVRACNLRVCESALTNCNEVVRCPEQESRFKPPHPGGMMAATRREAQDENWQLQAKGRYERSRDRVPKKRAESAKITRPTRYHSCQRPHQTPSCSRRKHLCLVPFIIARCRQRWSLTAWWLSYKPPRKRPHPWTVWNRSLFSLSIPAGLCKVSVLQ